MTNKADFIRRAMECIPTEKEMRDLIEKVLEKGLVDLSTAPDSFEAVYPLVGAIFEQRAEWAISGSCFPSTRRRMRREANFLKRNMPL